MIVFFENGRLGNQLFQYCAMRDHSPNETIVFFGGNELKSGFDGIKNTIFIPNTLFNLKLDYFFQLLHNSIINSRIFNIVHEVFIDGIPHKSIINGFFKSVTFFKAGYYQCPVTLNRSIANMIYIKDVYLNTIKEKLRIIPVKSKNFYFINIRRTDYLYWPDKLHPAVLPDSYFMNCVNQIINKNKEAYFIITTDDIDYVKRHFNNKRTIFFNNNAMEDFVMMVYCEGGGILSPSTFSWWASYFSSRINHNAIFFAPLYWAGHKKKKWYPEGIQTNWFDYVEVE